MQSTLNKIKVFPLFCVSGYGVHLSSASNANVSKTVNVKLGITNFYLP